MPAAVASPADLTEGDIREIFALFEQGKNISAVHLLRAKYGIGLADGKALMERVLELWAQETKSKVDY